ncbi:GAP family protein [Spirillospora sp. NPDC047279]|uniref:GAP family protein n=1 Tax=Spirillospora sp. NPDC047279 TaxID=3155478 RepID=UPI0033C55329
MELSSFALLFALALGLALRPLSLLAAVLFAAAKGGMIKLTAFVAGWMAALTAVGAAGALLLPEASTERTSAAHPGADVALGVLLAAFLIWRWRKSGATTATTPRWVARIDTMPPIVALGLGVLMPSYLLAAAAVNQLLQAGLTGWALASTIAAFVVVASFGVALPLLIALAKPDRAPDIHQRWQEWLLTNLRLVAYSTTALLAALLVAKGTLGLLLS